MVGWGICISVEMILSVVTLGWMVNSNRVGGTVNQKKILSGSGGRLADVLF